MDARDAVERSNALAVRDEKLGECCGGDEAFGDASCGANSFHTSNETVRGLQVCQCEQRDEYAYSDDGNYGGHGGIN